MESEYDRKFEDMKKYIPFLESMIKRLESTSTMSTNPRQAQLDKIRSLRDLLLDKKKRMKMENLLKCEQVLINLYAKVEQRDTLPNIKKSTISGSFDSLGLESTSSQLEIVRNKLKRVAKINDEADTLPEIVRASDVSDVCMSGGAEPALFQRRPHKKSPSLSDLSSGSHDKPKPPDLNSKRKYTRVLYSPEPGSRSKSANPDASLDSVLFSRRSPKNSSLQNKKEGKVKKTHKITKTKDLNITLKVPEESLNSLNTTDILSRIITCNDNDVDIQTLRGLRTQILSELKQTGAKDDISDLLLKSYASNKITTNKDEIEEGELSDSESEAIESIYGSLVLMDKDTTNTEKKSVPEKDQPRKIQICLVINPKESDSVNKGVLKPNQNISDHTELEISSQQESNKMESKGEEILKAGEMQSTSGVQSISEVVCFNDDVVSMKDQEILKLNENLIETQQNVDITTCEPPKASDKIVDNNELANKDVGSPKMHQQIEKKAGDSVQFQANFYKPLLDDEKVELADSKIDKNDNSSVKVEQTTITVMSSIILEKKENVKIPLLDEPVIACKPVEKDIDSQIDILQALKNEILGDNILSVQSLDVVTPPLHQPKLTKVSHTQGTISKKRISIEKYKEKSTPIMLNSSFSNETSVLSPHRDDNIKKQSLKLTEKECERFNFPVKVSLNDDISSEDEFQRESRISSEDIYTNFAPKSPDHDDTHCEEKKQPVIIPVDPIKAPVVNFKADVDMRTLPLLSPKETIIIDNNASTTVCQNVKEIKKTDIKFDQNTEIADRSQSSLMDPRMRNDSNKTIKIDNSNLAPMSLDKISSLGSGPLKNFVPNITPSGTPNSRSFDMTPNRLTDIDRVSPNNHVYAPSFTSFDSRDSNEQPILNDFYSPRDSEIGRRKSRWDEKNDSRSYNSQADNNRSRYGDTYKPDRIAGKNSDRCATDKNEDNIRGHDSMTPLPPYGWSENPSMPIPFKRTETPVPLLMLNFGRNDCPSTPSHPFGRSDCSPALGHPFNRSDMPGTPSHSFERTDCPMTPSHPFGRSECPTTPIHPFGRSDCPTTPIHPFGRSDCPATPSHPFGRTECPTTPSHPFGRSDVYTTSAILGRNDCPATPSHPFGRIDCPPTSSNHFTRMDNRSGTPFGMSDCPTTPCHPFGRTDCPPTPFGRLECPQTPSHHFGMSECPTTPSHPFGRVDGGGTPNYPYGRSEQKQDISMQQYSKDPRLNRRSDSRSLRDERDNRNYKDRVGFKTGGSYQSHSRSFGSSDSYRYDRDDGGRSRSISRNERNFDRTRSRENYFDQSNSTDSRDSHYYISRSRRRERCIEDRFRRDKSVGRNQNSRENSHNRTHSRSRSIGRTDNRETDNDNTLSVKSHAGRSFAIDTSVNSTFQDLLKNKGLEIIDQSFDSRKQRAASVGRSVRTRCYNLTSIDTSDESVRGNTERENKNYRRASSVGRDLHDTNDSFQKVKTDFKNYQKIIAMEYEKHCFKNNTFSEESQTKKHSNNQNVKCTLNTKKSSKQTYSPRRNYRDPRLRRDVDDSRRGSGNSYEKHKHGINYSNDNLARGAVLGSGYGVKNYKIPKIKRPIDENQENNTIDENNEPVDTKVKKDESKVINNKKNQSSDEEKNVTEESIRTGTRKSPRIAVRKSKRPVIYDSDSDTEITNKDTESSNIPSFDAKKDEQLQALESKTTDQSMQESKESLAKNDNEIFFDNIASDPVICNINSLIADLDDHINKSKTVSNDDLDFTLDEGLSNMSNTDNISLSNENTFDALFNKDITEQSAIIDELRCEKSKEENASSIEVFSNSAHSNLVNTELPTAFGEANNLEVSNSHLKHLPNPNNNSEIKSNEVNVSQTLLNDCDKIKMNSHNDAIVSTTDNAKEISDLLQEKIVIPAKSSDVNYETSPADSTNEVNVDKTKEQNIPDSTNEVHSEMNSVVSSSLNTGDISTKDIVEPNPQRNESVPPLDSIGSLLSILQDKSKINELLTMLGGQSGDNDKIKRKLEKLSEIVSDDDEEIPSKTVNKANDVTLTNEEEVTKPTDEKNDIKQHPNEEIIDTKPENTEEKNMTNAEHTEDTVDSDQPLIVNEKKSTRKKIPVKKGKGIKRHKGKFTKAKKQQQVTRPVAEKVEKTKPVKKQSRELLKLREDIKEMFLTDEMLNSTGIRMCRLAKLVDDKGPNRKEEPLQDPKPVVIVDKFKNQDISDEEVKEQPAKKKISPKIKRKASASEDLTNEEFKVANSKLKAATKNILGVKSKTKSSSKQDDIDPYEFEIDSVGTSTLKDSESEDGSDSEDNSLASSKSFGSTEVLADLQKKTKRKRRGKAWQTGVIKAKSKKKKQKNMTETLDEDPVNMQRKMVIPDNECFIDKSYCFEKNVTTYSCRLCEYIGDDIIIHYKKQHPHTEIPLSRMNPDVAKEAIEQCQAVNFPAISKISTDRYVCRFCFKEFSKSKTVLESFFWHVVSMHTGEYKQTCLECTNEACYFNLDIPPPPKDNTGQLIGYLCGKCNFTQVSLENLKTHVIDRHNDEQTDVYTINLATMSKKILKTLAKHQSTIVPRVLRSSRSNQSTGEANDDQSEMAENCSVNEFITEKEEQLITVKTETKSYATSMQAKIAFESEDNIATSDLGLGDHANSIQIKQEHFETDEATHVTPHVEPENSESNNIQLSTATEVSEPGLPDDVMAQAHFKVSYKESGAKEYVCCINGNENHYKTTLLISMKKHIQSKHDERWDGYCVLCKVIVTPQGAHNFRICLQHFLDKHMDDFPVLEKPIELLNDTSSSKISGEVIAESSISYINVRPLNQLLFSPVENAIETQINEAQFPKIQSVVSLGAQVELPRSSPTYPVICTETAEQKQYRYEDWQAEVMSKKHRVVLNAMMSEEKLVKVFKCTGKFCSFTTDNAENALLHATTHERIGGDGALSCAYCDFDASKNGIDLVMHVFKAHGKCPYACKLCFYRATSSQLVSSHISRMHSERQSFDAILHTTTVVASVSDDDGLMTREEAVPYYICGQRSEDETDACKFRTFTPVQFGEHLIKHSPPYTCHLCSSLSSSISELVHHMKVHGLRLYQCTSCVFGADCEPELLAHASARHPDRLPQAYLRVVTNKDGSTEVRVLPRAFLNKLKASSRDVTSGDTDNPVREAERSLALENLIGHTESVTSIEPVQTPNEPSDEDISTDTGIIEDTELLLNENIEQEPVAPSLPPSSNCSIRRESDTAVAEGVTAQIQSKPIADIASPVVKTEPEVKTPNTSSDTVVYCLDSDEEETRPRVIDLSDDDVISTPTASTSKVEEPHDYTKVMSTKLLVCPNCKIIPRNVGGFKRHMTLCLAKTPNVYDNVKCPHENCTRSLNGILEIADHYLKDHGDRRITVYACGVCKAMFKTVPLVKKHMRVVHKSTSFAVNNLMDIQGDNKVYTVTETPQRATLVRKSSAEAKRKAYGPQDIDRLPINPILDTLVHCTVCGFSTKVRLNMVRHLQLHAEQQPAPHTAPVNPVPHLASNERYFDKMVNLASSSAAARAPDKPARADAPPAPAADAARYPRYVPDRQRYTCGANNCSYISVDEGMLRIHWETLHSNTNDYLCVHCPPHQHLDQSKPLTAARIIGHLKMHEEDLYACSACSYYHFKRVAVEKHLPKCPQSHRDGQVIVVRECGVAPTPAPAASSAAPTMDLKPWQCGLCVFKSMLRPEVVNHCTAKHQSKMQFKCNYCPFRASAMENVRTHQTNAHLGKTEDVFYYYYREGSIPDDEDGTPRWMKQRQKSGVPEPVVKEEIPEPSTSQHEPVQRAPSPVLVNLNLVKKEAEDTETPEPEDFVGGDLNKKFGSFCDPSGTQYKCPLCSAVTEDSAEVMQSHLYEELKYRKWGCGFCSYKAFHKTGLSEHIQSEHHRQFQEPIELPINVNVEKWVAGLLEYQKNIIEKNKQNPQTNETPSTSKAPEGIEVNLEELEKAFGSFGTPHDSLYCCPKCNCTLQDERVMKEHLESELNKIRWCCSVCPFTAQSYHEAQFHCSSVHAGQGASPREAERSADKRAAWVRAAVRHQQRRRPLAPHAPPAPAPLPDPADAADNSLLVVRYEERVASPDAARRKRAAPDSDDEKLVIDETEPPTKNKLFNMKSCQYCDFETRWPASLKEHTLRHYYLKPYKCLHCDYTSHRSTMLKHIETFHPGKSYRMKSTPIPKEPPSLLVLPKSNMKKPSVVEDEAENICLHCGKAFFSKDLETHRHGNTSSEFAKKGQVVVKCCICLVLRLDVSSLQEHHQEAHPGVPVNYAYFKLHCDTLECFYCEHCKRRFSFLRDLRSHHKATHPGMQLKYVAVIPRTDTEEASTTKRKNEDEIIEPKPKKVAKKSTTKLPHNTVAKKSTTKLPNNVDMNEDNEEFSYYGSKPQSLDNYANVTTLMPFCNTLVPFTVKKLSEIIKIEPVVLINDENE